MRLPSVKDSYCSFLKEDCIRDGCLFWLNECRTMSRVNQIESFSILTSLISIAKEKSLGDVIKSADPEVSKRLLSTIDPYDGQHLLALMPFQSTLELILSLASTDLPGKERIEALINICQLLNLKLEGIGYMEEIRKKDPALDNLFGRVSWWTFDKLEQIDDAGTKRLFAECRDLEIAISLKTCWSSLKDKIFSSLDADRAAHIKNMMDGIDISAIDNVERYEALILKRVAALVEMGEIKVLPDAYIAMLKERQAVAEDGQC